MNCRVKKSYCFTVSNSYKIISTPNVTVEGNKVTVDMDLCRDLNDGDFYAITKDDEIVGIAVYNVKDTAVPNIVSCYVGWRITDNALIVCTDLSGFGESNGIRPAESVEISEFHKRLDIDRLSWDSKQKKLRKSFHPGDVVKCETTNSIYLLKNSVYETDKKVAIHLAYNCNTKNVNMDTYANFPSELNNYILLRGEERRTFLAEIYEITGQRYDETSNKLVYIPKSGDFVCFGKFKNVYGIYDKGLGKCFKAFIVKNSSGYYFDEDGWDSNNLRKMTIDEISKFLSGIKRDLGKEWDSSCKKLVNAKWEPKDGEGYFYVSFRGKVNRTTWDSFSPICIGHKQMNNIFRTCEYAYEALENLQDLLKNSRHC